MIIETPILVMLGVLAIGCVIATANVRAPVLCFRLGVFPTFESTSKTRIRSAKPQLKVVQTKPLIVNSLQATVLAAGCEHHRRVALVSL